MLTAETVAVKPAVAAPGATVTLAGTATAELLLAKLTVKPPLAAATFSVTVQLSVPAPVIDPLLQLRPLSVGTPVFSCRPNVCATPPALAVNTAV